MDLLPGRTTREMGGKEICPGSVVEEPEVGELGVGVGKKKCREEVR